MRNLFRSWIAVLVTSGISNIASSTTSTVPKDRLMARGPQTYEGQIGDCKVEIPLALGDYFWTSPSVNDAVFYSPVSRIKDESSPYLYKPDVESYSDMGWKYIKPPPTGEPWFGLMCVPVASGENSPFVEVNCPSQWIDGRWVLLDGYARLYEPPIPLIGTNWNGFSIASKPLRTLHTGEFLNIKFCLFGNQQIIMGQSQTISTVNYLRLLKTVQTMKFPDLNVPRR
jgi:hypothetical protein